MHSLLFLDPGHFHAALTLRVRQARAADEVFVYAHEGAELRDFLALVERFNRRASNPTRWRPIVTTADDPLGRLVDERRGDVVVLAGRNGGKARTIRRLHESGFHVLADKPWLVEPADLEHVRASLEGWPLAAEIMTGRHDVAAGLVKRLVGAPALFGAFRDVGLAIEQESVHHLEKLVDGAPLRRPWWFFDVRVQGSGPVDIPTHVVDQAQWLVDGDAAAPALLSARAWSTRVPAEAFRRITGEAGFPRELEPFVDGDTLSYRCNAELVYQIGRNKWSTLKIAAVGTPAAMGVTACAWPGARPPDLVVELVVTSKWDTATIKVGAPFRSFRKVEYAEYQDNNRWWLGRKVGDATSFEQLTGPLLDPASDGLAFTYYDTLGAPTANSAAVGKVGFRLRTESFKKTTVGSAFTYQRDSLETVIALRR